MLVHSHTAQQYWVLYTVNAKNNTEKSNPVIINSSRFNGPTATLVKNFNLLPHKKIILQADFNFSTPPVMFGLKIQTDNTIVIHEKMTSDYIRKNSENYHFTPYLMSRTTWVT
jgi:hypothetical protein